MKEPAIGISTCTSAPIYTKTDAKIDKYLGTTNLRPGPPLRLVNRKLLGDDDEIEMKRKHKSDSKLQVNFFSYTMEVKRGIKWDELTAVKKSGDESEIFFLEFLNNKLLVLKGSLDIPSLLFGTLLAQSLGIETPNIRLVEYKDPEFNEMILNLERASMIDASTHHKILYDIKNKPFLLLLEYVPSLSLYEFGPNRAYSLFTKANPKAREIMIGVGKIIGLDIFLNNSNRLPWLWGNLGNPNNILFQVNLDMLPPNANFKDPKFIDVYLENPVAYDTKAFPLDPDDKQMLAALGDYMNRLSGNFREFFYDFKNVIIYGKDIETFEFKCFTKLQEFFQKCCGYMLDPYNFLHISEGIVIMINQILEIEEQDLENFIDFICKKVISQDWADVYQNSAKSLKMNYFKYMLNFLKNLKEENEDVFKWVSDITLDFYSTHYKENLTLLIDLQTELKFNSKKPKKKKTTKINTNIIDDTNSQAKKPPEDFFNLNKNDPKTFINDVHNGIYDMFDLDPNLIMELRKREYQKLKDDAKDQALPNPDPVNNVDKVKMKKLEVEKIEEELDPHKIYTIEELKNKIKKDELKGTFKIKKKFNPEEAQFLEEKIKNVDEEFLKEDAEEEPSKQPNRSKSRKKNSGEINEEEQIDDSPVKEGKKKKKSSRSRSREGEKKNEEEENPIEEEEERPKKKRKKKKESEIIEDMQEDEEPQKKKKKKSKTTIEEDEN